MCARGEISYMYHVFIKGISLINVVHSINTEYTLPEKCENRIYGPRQANLVFIAYASSEGSGEPAHPRSLARTFAARS